MDTEALLPGPETDRADVDASWLSRSVRLVACCIAGGLVLSLTLHPLLGGPPLPAASAVEVGGMLAMALALWLNRRGRPTAAGRVVAFTIPLLAGGLALTARRGFHDPAILMMPGALILCGVLLDRATLVATTVLAAAATTAVIAAEARGLIQVRSGDTVLGDAFDTVVILGITGLAVEIVAGRLRRTIGRLRQREAAARASELRYRSFVEQAVEAIVAGAEDGGFTEANRRASEITGYSREELLGRKLESLFSPEERQRVPFRYDALVRGETVVAERMLTRKDGSVVPVEMSSKQMPDGVYQSSLRDISERYRAEAERRSLEARLRQAQKMEAVGRLAGGIAHDFNNLLTALTGSLTLGLRLLGEASPARRWLNEVDKAAWRAASLTRHLLTFSRQQVIEPRVLDLRSVVEETASLVARTVGEDVSLHVHLPDEPCRVAVDQGQMEQIILNLVTNARDAMPEGGLLTLDVGWAEEPDGRVVVLSVSDTGHGMSEQVRARIFE
ncbi:MAG TPA: PAS domain S-box protein, partial [Vicinamibacteria bacterium]|nr:PAS domain S-box protein [Vicinamibacteria bacterium]